MSDSHDNEEKGVVGFVVGGAVILAIFIALLAGLWASGALTNSSAANSDGLILPGVQTTAPATAPAVAPIQAPAGAASAPAAEAPDMAKIGKDGGVVVAADGTVKLYFASGKSELPLETGSSIKPIVDKAKADEKLKVIISGFHDSTGSAAKNAELAKKRAFAARDALMQAGVPEQHIELKKPEATTGTGDNAEARRVEISLK